ncbi:MAG: hypothetical protein K2W96_18030 [Gemmataceae bacterium]|nr:hypothetical protein [Gemmataceae bacterium]
MSEPTPPPPVAPPDPGLPPVEPPSAQLMVRLFLVPGLIVAGLVLLFLAGPYLSRLIGFSSEDSRTADQFLRQLDSENLDIRYRAASDLAQVLLRKDELAADPVFALELASRLHDALERSKEEERKLAAGYEGMTAGERAKTEKAREPDRTLAMFLSACLGNCIVPAGAPLLCEQAKQARGMEAGALVERRRRALFALSTLGDRLKRFDALDDEKKDAILAKLKEAEGTPGHADRPRKTREYLAARRAGKADSMGVVDALEAAAGDGDPFIREAAAFAANFWTGDAKEESRLEDMLLRLSRDGGEGEDRLAERRKEGGEDPRAIREVTTRKGFTIQANATLALARRGSPKTRLDLLEELLSPEVLRKVFVMQSAGRDEKPNEELVSVTVVGALRATAELAKKRPGMKLGDLAKRVEELRSGYAAGITKEADAAAEALGKR